ncbi:hypothetical protein NL676_020807 [Syzygium grande]|nr:hypothetical protein NL676_020807 [Syzygium grande]
MTLPVTRIDSVDAVPATPPPPQRPSLPPRSTSLVFDAIVKTHQFDYVDQTQIALACISLGTKDWLRWRLMTSLVPPTSSPPMNTVGTGGLRPSLERACSISLGDLVQLVNYRVDPELT